ncbi:MAG: mcrBC [Phycisphaerales bacterium]|nr:mcrBC [Phycisphaerales bacterium]
MTPVTVFEHQPVPFNWTDRDLAALDRLNRALGTEVLRPSVRGTQRVLVAAQHVGVVRLAGRTIQILPKIHASPDSAGPAVTKRESTANLLHLLEHAGQIRVRDHDIASLASRRTDWFEILTRLFASNMAEQWERGPHRIYQPIDEDLPVLKGTWRIADQIRRPATRHLFAVTHDTFTADTPLNRVFRYVVERLFKLTRDSDNRQALGELRQWMDEVTLPGSVRAADATPALLTRLSARFAPLLNLARLFLDESTLHLTAGGTDTFAFVFDMNALFEAFVVNFIRRHRDQILPPELQDCELLAQTVGATRHLAKASSGNVFRLQPDLAVCHGQKFPLLIDAKYKRLGIQERNLGVAREDFYQMHAYARRYCCARVLMVYPAQSAEGFTWPNDFHLLDSSLAGHTGGRISVVAMPLDVPLGTKDGRDRIMQCFRRSFSNGVQDG